MPATHALRADLVPAKVRGKLFGGYRLAVRGLGLPFFISGILGLTSLALLLLFVEEPPRKTEKRNMKVKP